MQLLKCPADNTPAITSYIMNPDVSGKRFGEISPTSAQTTALFIEKGFPGNHGLTVYADGHVSK